MSEKSLEEAWASEQSEQGVRLPKKIGFLKRLMNYIKKSKKSTLR